MPSTAIRRARALAWSALALGLVVSLWANMAAAEPTGRARVVAALAPAGLFICIELLHRIPTRGRALDRVRVGFTLALAAVAAWVSYWHMVALALEAGESVVAAHLLPLVPDGVIAVAALSLVSIETPVVKAKPKRQPDPSPARPAVAPPVEETNRPRAGLATAGDPRAAARQLSAQGLTQAQIAERLSKSERQVRRYLNEEAS